MDCKIVTARLVLYTSREYPLKSGYRPLFLIEKNYYSGIICFDGDDIKQNEARNVKIGFLTYKGQLKEGEVLKFFESPNNEIGEICISQQISGTYKNNRTAHHCQEPPVRH